MGTVGGGKQKEELSKHRELKLLIINHPDMGMDTTIKN
jgi:hypothetical protein